MHTLGQAAVAGLRNIVAHEDVEFAQPEALEYLALLSVLARWIDDSDVVPADSVVSTHEPVLAAIDPL